MKESLFTRLASYSQNPNKRSNENFLTEVLAYLINNDRVFRRAFVHHIIPDGRIQRGFARASALPQQTVGRGIVDLVLTGTGGSRVFVEVKIGAKETLTKIHGYGWVPQVRKYLSNRSGQVAYLTTRNVPSPDVNSGYFLGHFFLEELDTRLRRLDRNGLSTPGQLLLDFMKENDMKAPDPFTKMDLKYAAHSFDFAKKCEAVLNEVVRKIEPEFKELFRTRTGFTPGRFSPTSNYASSYTRKFRYRAATYVSIYLATWEGELGFGVSAKVPKKDLERIHRHLDWEEDQGEIYSWHVVRSGTHPTALAPKVLGDARKLRTALNRAYG
jgi:hypothetical protein